MGLYRDESGLVLELDDAFADARGYAPIDPTEEQQIYAERGLAARADEGVGGMVRAGVNRFASGATLGLTDVALDQFMSPAEREQLQLDIEAHPYVSTGAEMAGMVAPALAAPGSALSKAPAGYLSSIAAREVEHGLARGGLGGTARALNAMGAEGAIQGVGQYIGHSAIEDKDVTAEGLAGALGTGYAFGSAGGGAALGVVKGTVAARRMFSRVMDSRAAKDAESAWSLASEEALEADRATAQSLQTRLDEIRKAKQEALRYRNETKAMTEEERIRASTAAPRPEAPAGVVEMEGPVPLDDGIAPASGGGQTSIYQRTAPADPLEGPLPLDEGIAPAEGGMPTSIKKVERTPEGTKITDVAKYQERVAAREAAGAPQGPATDLEKQLAGTKGALDEGKQLKEIGKKPTGSGEVTKVAPHPSKFQGPEMPPQVGPTSRAPFSNLRSQLGKKLLPESLADIRMERTAELLSPEIAKEEARIVAALDEMNAAREALKRIDDSLRAPVTGEGLPADAGTHVGRAPRQRAMEALDAAHEDALINAQAALDPAEAGAWLQKAEEVEELMMKLPDDQNIYWDLGESVHVVSQYEEALRKAVEVAGDAAHPSAQAFADGLGKATAEAERKVMERTARAVDDAELHGPAYKTPKERVAYARERHLDATKAVDDIKLNEAAVKDELAYTNRKVKAGEKAKKDALRVEAKGPGMAEKVGALELLDLPGLPKVSDLPVVGPLLGAWLKYRTLKAALGRKFGRVTATADARAAVAAARTRDRIARAVDRSLGLVNTGARTTMKYAPKAAGILATRIYDDGEPAPKKGAPLGELAAARVRELAAYVHTPGAIERDVRVQLGGITDPDLIAAAEQHRRMMMEYLLKNAPKAPEQGMLKTVNWQPSPAEAMSFARRLEAVGDPAGTWERFAEQHALLSLEAAEALRTVYPKLFLQAQQRVLERVAEVKAAIPYRTRVQMSLLYQLPLDASLEPANLQITQSVYERKMVAPPGAPGTPPTPSVAGETNLTAIFQTTADRNALRR